MSGTNPSTKWLKASAPKDLLLLWFKGDDLTEKCYVHSVLLTFYCKVNQLGHHNQGATLDL